MVQKFLAMDYMLFQGRAGRAPSRCPRVSPKYFLAWYDEWAYAVVADEDIILIAWLDWNLKTATDFTLLRYITPNGFATITVGIGFLRRSSRKISLSPHLYNIMWLYVGSSLVALSLRSRALSLKLRDSTSRSAMFICVDLPSRKFNWPLNFLCLL